MKIIKYIVVDMPAQQNLTTTKPYRNIQSLPCELRLQILRDVIKNCPYNFSDMIGGRHPTCGWQWGFSTWKLTNFYKCMELKTIFPKDILELFIKPEDREVWKHALGFKEICEADGKKWNVVLHDEVTSLRRP